MKDNPPETGIETDCTLIGAEIERDITGTGVRSEKVTAIATDPGGTTEITINNIDHIGTVCLSMIATTGMWSLSVAGSELTTQGSVIGIGALTITIIIATTAERTGNVSGGDTVTPTEMTLTAAGGGRRIKSHG